MLELERALELLGLDDGVDAELARIALVGVLQRALAALEQSTRAAVDARLAPASERAALPARRSSVESIATSDSENACS